MPSLSRRQKPPKLTDLPDAEWRLALALAADGDPRGIPVLLDIMHERDAEKAAAAEEAIRSFGHAALPELKRAFMLPRKFNSELVGELLLTLPGEEVAPFLAGAIERRNVREAALRALAKVRHPRAVDALIATATNGPRGSRQTTIWALGCQRDARGFDAISAALSARDPELRSAAVHALGRIDDPRVTELLIAMLSDRERDVRGTAVRALGDRRDPRAVTEVLRVLRDEASDPVANSYTAAKALAQLGPDGVDALIEVADDEHPKIRSYALTGLNTHPRARLNDDRILPLLIKRLADEDGYTSHTAASALHQYPDDGTAALILPHLDDPRSHVRESAIYAIWIHHHEAVARKLASLLRSDPDATVRCQAAHGLLVRPRPEGFDALLDAITDDPDERVQKKAKEALGAVRAATAKHAAGQARA